MGRILIVDDYPENRRALVKLIERVHGPATCVESGPEALRILESQDVQLVFLDWMMPGMSGLEVLRAIRASPKNAALPVVMYSATSDPDRRQLALESGAQDYVVKGDLDHLLKAVATFAADKGRPN